MIDFIAVLDHHHLDQTFFMKSLAREIALRREARIVLLHGDSPYTERIMQDGVMREEAQVRAVKDLNHRLVALLADEGISAVGLHPFQKALFTRSEEGAMVLNRTEWDRLPRLPVIILSNLFEGRLLPLADFSRALELQLPAGDRVVFGTKDALEWQTSNPLGSQSPSTVPREWIPEEFVEDSGFRFSVIGAGDEARLFGGTIRIG